MLRRLGRSVYMFICSRNLIGSSALRVSAYLLIVDSAVRYSNAIWNRAGHIPATGVAQSFWFLVPGSLFSRVPSYLSCNYSSARPRRAEREIRADLPHWVRYVVFLRPFRYLPVQ